MARTDSVDEALKRLDSYYAGAGVVNDPDMEVELLRELYWAI